MYVLGGRDSLPWHVASHALLVEGGHDRQQEGEDGGRPRGAPRGPRRVSFGFLVILYRLQTMCAVGRLLYTAAVWWCASVILHVRRVQQLLAVHNKQVWWRAFIDWSYICIYIYLAAVKAI